MQPIRLLATSLSLALVTAGSVGACSADRPTVIPSTTAAGGTGGGASTAAGSDDTSAGTSDSDGDIVLDAGQGGNSSGGGGSGCALSTQFIYTLARDTTLYRFDPPALSFTEIGKLDCPPSIATPFSMAVDRDAQAWVIFTDGTLAQVDTNNAHCTKTSFVPGQSGFTTFGMGFSSNSPGSVDETLYVSESSFGSPTLGLARIDLKTLTLVPIGMYDKLSARAEMTGTGDARLFAAFEGTPYNVAEVHTTDAKILSQAPQTAINYAPGSSNFAFAFWGGDFWLFVGPGTSTEVFQLQPATGVTTKVTSTSAQIVGAGVSTCAPTKPPA